MINKITKPETIDFIVLSKLVKKENELNKIITSE